MENTAAQGESSPRKVRNWPSHAKKMWHFAQTTKLRLDGRKVKIPRNTKKHQDSWRLGVMELETLWVSTGRFVPQWRDSGAISLATLGGSWKGKRKS